MPIGIWLLTNIRVGKAVTQIRIPVRLGGSESVAVTYGPGLVYDNLGTVTHVHPWKEERSG